MAMKRAKRRRRKTKAEREGDARLAREMRRAEARTTEYLLRFRRGLYLEHCGLGREGVPTDELAGP